MNQILGTVASLTVIILAIVAICRIQDAIRYHKTHSSMARILLRACARPLDRPSAAGTSRMAVIIGMGRRMRPRKHIAVAGAGLFGVAVTYGCFLAFGPDTHDAPTANQPEPLIVRTLATTVTQQLPATITRTVGGEVTVIQPRLTAPLTTAGVPVSDAPTPSRAVFATRASTPAGSPAARSQSPSVPASVTPDVTAEAATSIAASPSAPTTPPPSTVATTNP